MHALLRLLPGGNPVVMLAGLAGLAGAGGMALSYTYLASAHPLDVQAGTAGFLAGAILLAAGLVAVSLQRPAQPARSAAPPFNLARWRAHFRANAANRPEPDWHAPLTLPAEVVRPLVRSIEPTPSNGPSTGNSLSRKLAPGNDSPDPVSQTGPCHPDA